MSTKKVEKSETRANRRGKDIEPNEPYDIDTDPLRFDDGENEVDREEKVKMLNKSRSTS